MICIMSYPREFFVKPALTSRFAQINGCIVAKKWYDNGIIRTTFKSKKVYGFFRTIYIGSAAPMITRHYVRITLYIK